MKGKSQEARPDPIPRNKQPMTLRDYISTTILIVLWITLYWMLNRLDIRNGLMILGILLLLLIAVFIYSCVQALCEKEWGRAFAYAMSAILEYLIFRNYLSIWWRAVLEFSQWFHE
jgi:hypothetical protein